METGIRPGFPAFHRLLPLVLTLLLCSPFRPLAAQSNNAPNASLSHSPTNPEVGEPITLDASGSSDPDGSIVEYRWDLDGDGTMDDATTTDPQVTTSFSSSGTRYAGVDVVDDDGATATASTEIQVQEANNAPNASLSHSPTNPEVGETITLDASGSSDPDGSIVEYRWDLDGDGTMDDATTTDPQVTTSFSSSGTRYAGVDVVDDDGATATASTEIQVQDESEPPSVDADQIVAALAGDSDALSSDAADYLDEHGNQNGQLDVGDFLAWLHRNQE